jgi:hypothetical protein
MVFNPNATIRSRLFQKISEWTKIKDSGKKIVFVWGTDKPRINLDLKTNKYYFNFIDYIDNAMNAKWQSENIEGDFVEFFYWSPDLPEIPIKQSHIVKNYLRNSNKCSQFLSKFKKNTLGYAQIDNEKYYISNSGVNFLIYPKYNYNILNEWKPAGIFLTERDAWFFNLSKNEKAFTNWQSSVTALWKKLPYYWKNDPSDFTKSIKASVSRRYYLE